MIAKIPNQGKYSQPNKGKIFGNLWATWNIDLSSNTGRLRLAPHSNLLANSVANTDMGYPVAIVRSSGGQDGTDQWWALTEGRIFRSSSSDPTASWVRESANSDYITSLYPPTINSDMVDFNHKLFITGQQYHIAWESSGDNWFAWTTPAMTSGFPHPMCVGFNNLLLTGDGNVVHTRDINGNIATARLTFKKEFQCIWIISSSVGYWIGCRNLLDNEAEVFFWDGSSQNFNNNFRVFHKECFVGCILNDLPYVVNGNGQLLKFTGGGFEEIARFPIADDKNNRWNTGETIPRPIHKNGMRVINGKINILVSAGINGTKTTQIENMLSGIWEYDQEIGLYHKYSITKDTGSGVIDWGSPVLSMAGAITSTSKDKGTILGGAGLYTQDGNTTTTELKVLFNLDANGTTPNRGYFISPQIPTDQIEDVWQQTWVKFKKLTNSTDRIIVKFRTSEKSFVNLDNGCTVAWSDSDTFTTTETSFVNVAAGDEIEILSGEGSGTSAHVTSITETSGTYSVNLDTTVTDASGNALVRASNWIKLGEISDQNITWQDYLIGEQSEWIQLKVESRGTGNSPEINETIIKSANNITI